MSVLQRFQGDASTKEALMEFIQHAIDQEALTRMYAGEDVSHIKDATDLLKRAFELLDETYGPVITQSAEKTNHSK